MQVFWLPPDANCEAVYRLGGVRDEPSLVVHSDYKIDVPTLPVLFAYQIALWVAVRYDEVKPEKKQYCFHLEAQCAASLHELAKLVHGNVKDGFCIAAPSHGKARPGLLSPQQKAIFKNYREARANLSEASSNMERAEIGRNQADVLLYQVKDTWQKAERMMMSVEAACRDAGFDPRKYLEDRVSD
jgi:hypothetical protein